MASKKELRSQAVQNKLERRRKETLNSRPISLNEYCDLLKFVTIRTIRSPGNRCFEATLEGLCNQKVSVEPMFQFLEANGITDDWWFILKGDPFKMFGPRNGHLHRMPIPRESLIELIDQVDRNVATQGCDHSHRFVEAFLAKHSEEKTLLTIGALAALGGGCDCEVVLNVSVDEVFESL